MADFRLPLNYKEKVGRAVHNRSTTKRFTLHPMVLTPAFCMRMKRGESYIYSIPQYILDSLPTHSPVLGGYRLRVEWYFNPDANHCGWLDNDTRLTTQEVLERRHHTFTPNMLDTSYLSDYLIMEHEDSADTSNVEISNYEGILRKYGNGIGSLLDFCGVTPGYIPSKYMGESPVAYLDTKQYFGNVFNLDYILTYLNIIRCYHTNQQFPDVPFTRLRTFAADRLVGESSYDTYNLEDLDNLFMYLRYCHNGVHFKAFTSQDDYFEKNDLVSVENVDDYVSSHDVPLRYRQAVAKFISYLRSVSRSHGGLFCSEYMPDLYRNLLPTDVDTIKAYVETNADGSFSIESFRFQNRLQAIYDRINPFGGKDSTQARTRWGVESRRNYDVPDLINSFTQYIGTNAIRSDNAGETSVGGESVKSVPGSLSGNTQSRGNLSGKQKFTATEPGTLMCIVSLVPYVDYSMNIQRELLTNNFEDEFSPQMAQRGFDTVPMTDYCALPVGSVSSFYDDDLQSYRLREVSLSAPLNRVVGKQVAWLHDMTNTSRVHGNFTRFGDLQTWCLVRDYLKVTEYSSTTDGYVSLIDSTAVFELSPYGYPEQWQYMFVANSLDDDNWMAQMVFDVKDVSPVGYRFMPTLGI